MTPELVTKIESLTGQRAHRLIRRGMFFCHRDLDQCLNAYEKKQPFYLYTGRGPSAEALHLGHTIPFIFTQWLQQAFDIPLVIQITDDEKFLYKEDLELEQTIRMGRSNIKDIIAFGFDPEKTFIFSDTAYIGTMYPNVLKVQKNVTYSQMKGIFGTKESDNVGKLAYPPVQAVPSFSNTFPHIFGSSNVQCLIPAAIDQDPYFRMTRDVAQKLKYLKTATYYSTFIPALQGKKTKMSSSSGQSSILLTDSPKAVADKIKKYAFSGGQQTVEEHRRLGADLDIDIPFQYLEFFLEDDELLETIRSKYSSGEMLTGEVKDVLIKEVQAFLKVYQERRAKVTEEEVEKFMAVRKISPYPKAWKEIIEERERVQAEKEAAQKLKEEEKAKRRAEEEAKKQAKLAEKEAKKQAAREFAIRKKEEEAKKQAEAGQ
mmetsp:Transcript_11813/g.19963  ORF Transcript_11813/g.19963 Transcript_11813/m.19963 type:complete len:430 (-) Transcript_11813:25-1314(-)